MIERDGITSMQARSRIRAYGRKNAYVLKLPYLQRITLEFYDMQVFSSCFQGRANHSVQTSYFLTDFAYS